MNWNFYVEKCLWYNKNLNKLSFKNILYKSVSIKQLNYNLNFPTTEKKY